MARRRGTASRYSHSAAGRRTSRKLTKREQENIAKAFFWIFFGWWLILLKLLFWDLPVAIIKAVSKKNRPQQTVSNANINNITQNAYNPLSTSKAPSQPQQSKLTQVTNKQVGWAIIGFFALCITFGIIISSTTPKPARTNVAPVIISEEPSKDISVEEIVESAEKPVESEEESIESKEESIESKAESTEKSVVSEVSVKREVSTRREQPSVVSKAEKVVTPQPREFTFYLNTKTKVYHTTMCGAAQQILPENLRTVTTTFDKKDDTAREIEREGYRLCKRC